jgi:hypothetical protein
MVEEEREGTMTSAAKHMARSHRSHTHFTTSRNYQDRPSKHGVSIDALAAAITRRPRWFWNLVGYIQRQFYSVGRW